MTAPAAPAVPAGRSRPWWRWLMWLSPYWIAVRVIRRLRRGDHRQRDAFDATRLQQRRIRRRLAMADVTDVEALEAYQRDLEQEAADVAQRLRELHPTTP